MPSNLTGAEPKLQPADSTWGIQRTPTSRGATDLSHLFIILLMALAPFATAWAALGGKPMAATAATSADSPRSYRLVQTPKAENDAAYTENVLTHSNGTVVREFVNASGAVFAIRWAGSVLPDFSALFGNHFAALKAEAERMRSSRRRGGPLIIQSDTLVVVSRGHSQQFSGFAYVRSLIPVGVDVDGLMR